MDPDSGAQHSSTRLLHHSSTAQSVRRYAIAAAIALLTAAALAFRLPSLGNRPMHADEAVHAFKFRDLWEHGVYRYDPNEFHGPTLYYAALPTVWLSGHRRFEDTQEADYRLATALAGAAMVPLLALLADGLGRRATLWAALLAAISPAFVFYSRYYIQETLLVLFTLAALACGWRYRRSGKLGWLLGAGAAAGLMAATKETAVLTFLAAGFAWLAVCRGRVSVPRAVLAVFVALALATLILTGLLSNPRGAVDVLKAFSPWLRRAGEASIHHHPWYYYFQLLIWTHRARGPVWSELLIAALAVVGGVAVVRRPDAALPRFLAVYTIVVTAIYCAIPYKTPWCVLNFLLGMILLAGVGAEAIFDFRSSILSFRRARPRGFPGSDEEKAAARPPHSRALGALLTLLILAGSAQLGWQSYRTSFVYFADNRNPYVYAQTSPDILNLTSRVQDLARVSPQGADTVVKVFSVDPYYWPLPWYLRRMHNVGYWVGVPPEVAAPIVIASSPLDDALTPRLNPTHLMSGFFGLRPGALVEVWVQMDLWTRYVQSRPRPKEDEE